MEAAASIAGILGLAGQCIEGAITLRTFWHDIKNASKTAAQFLGDLNSLIQTLDDIKKLLGSIKDEVRLKQHDLDSVTLQIHLQECDKELRQWILTAQKSRPNNGKGVKHWFKNFMAAVDKDSIREIRRELRSRRQALDLALSVLGRALDVQNIVCTKDVGDAVSANQTQLLKVLKTLQERYDNLDLKLDTISQSSFGSHPSLRSTASAPLSATGRLAEGFSTEDYIAWKLPEEHDPDFELDTGSQHSGASGQSDPGLSAWRKGSRDSPRPSTPSRSRLPSQEYLRRHRRRRSSENITRDPQEPDHDSYWNEIDAEEGMPKFQRHCWDSAMLTQWTDGRDRVNKWMLHSLGVDGRQAALHQRILADELDRTPLSLPDLLHEDGPWERLAFQYWMIDEASLGSNMLRPSDLDTIPSLGPPSLRTNRSSQDLSIEVTVQDPIRKQAQPERHVPGPFFPPAAITTPPDSSEGSECAGTEEELWEIRLKALQEAVRAIPIKRTGSPSASARSQRVRSLSRDFVPVAQWRSSADTSEDEMELFPPRLLRKKNGELLKPALRSARTWRRSSAPGTPVYSKAVYFDDTLDRVRHFLQVDRPLAISASTSPVEQYDEEADFPFGPQLQGTHESAGTRPPVSSSRYDFGASLKMALAAAQETLHADVTTTLPGTVAEKASLTTGPGLPLKTFGKAPSVWPAAEEVETYASLVQKHRSTATLTGDAGQKDLENVFPAARFDVRTEKTTEVNDSLRPAMGSDEYKALIEKYCFVGSTKPKAGEPKVAWR